jgi:hypothetical protein
MKTFLPAIIALLGFPNISPSPSTTTERSARAQVDLLSLETCRAEFRWLDAHWRQLDLSAAPVHTDGWTSNIAEAEWPVMGLSYHGYGAANLAKADPAFRDEYLAAMRNVLVAHRQFSRVVCAGGLRPEI